MLPVLPGFVLASARLALHSIAAESAVETCYFGRFRIVRLIAATPA